MIVIALIVAIGARPPVLLHSQNTFATMEACEAARASEAPQVAAARDQLAARFGQPVSIRSGCIYLARGTAA